jgi:hypothetical protein
MPWFEFCQSDPPTSAAIDLMDFREVFSGSLEKRIARANKKQEVEEPSRGDVA